MRFGCLLAVLAFAATGCDSKCANVPDTTELGCAAQDGGAGCIGPPPYGSSDASPSATFPIGCVATTSECSSAWNGPIQCTCESSGWSCPL